MSNPGSEGTVLKFSPLFFKNGHSPDTSAWGQAKKIFEPENFEPELAELGLLSEGGGVTP